MTVRSLAGKDQSPKIFLLAIDGLSYPLVSHWGAQGDLPALKRLMEEGCYGVMEPFSPSNSAVIWTSVMTGMHPLKHGVDSFVFYSMGGWTFRKSVVKRVLKLGVRPVFNRLKVRGYLREVPFSLLRVQQKMLWEIFAQKERRVGVVNWWHSWPAYEVPGFIISDRVYYWRTLERQPGSTEAHQRLVFPEGLLDEVRKRIIDPFLVPQEVYQRFMKVERKVIDEMKNAHFLRHQLMSEFKYLYSMDESMKILTLFCLEKFLQPDFLAVYFRGVDIVSHCALKYMPEHRDPQVTTSEVEQFGETVHEYYCYMDHIVGELLAALSPATMVAIVSDHGFAREPDGRFGHRKTKPPGMFIMSGKQVKRGLRVDGKSLYDIAPTLLYLGGLPVSQEMEGTVLAECIHDEWLQENPVSFIESYGLPLRSWVTSSLDEEEEMKERLRALGYME